MRRIVASVFALACLSGCPSFTTMGTARVIPKGETQFQVAIGGQQLRDWTVSDSGALDTITVPGFEIGVSRAVSDSVEVGGKIWLLGAELNSKFQLLRSESPQRGIDVALAPALSFYPLSTENAAGDKATGGLLFVHLPLLVGFNLPGGSQVIFGPRISDTVAWSRAAGVSESTNLIWLGGSFGVAIKAGDGFMIQPQVSAMYPAAVSHALQTTTDLAFKGVVVQGQVALVFGG